MSKVKVSTYKETATKTVIGYREEGIFGYITKGRDRGGLYTYVDVGWHQIEARDAEMVRDMIESTEVLLEELRGAEKFLAARSESLDDSI